MDSEHNKLVYGRIVAKAWTDEAFKAEFLADPTKVARDHGMQLHGDAVVAIVETGAPFSVDTAGKHPVVRVVLPARPADLTDEDVLNYKGQAYACSCLS